MHPKNQLENKRLFATGGNGQTRPKKVPAPPAPAQKPADKPKK